MRRGGARREFPVRPAKRAAPQFTTIRSGPLENSKDRQPACACAESVEGRRGAGVHQHDRCAGGDPLVAGMRRVVDRASRARRHRPGSWPRGRSGRAGPVELREVAVAVPEEAQHRRHAVDRGDERLRRLRGCAPHRPAGAGSGRSSRSTSIGRIAADMAAIGQDLPVELLAERQRGRALQPRLAGEAQARIGERRRRPRAAARPPARRRPPPESARLWRARLFRKRR